MTPFPSGASFTRGRLTAIGGVGVGELARRYGTPLYVLDRRELLARMRAYRRAFGPGVAVTYAAKALCVTGLLQLVAAEGLHVDVASGGELFTALRASFPPERIVFHGNNKSVAELEQAAGTGVGRIVVDSFTELRRLDEVGARHGRRFDILVRVTPGIEAHTHEFIRTGHDDSKFGFTLSSGLAHRAVAEASRLQHVRMRGLHAHIGSQVFTLDAFVANAVALCRLLDEIREIREVGGAHGADELNLGGGLGIVYAAGDDPPTLDAYARAVLNTVASESQRLGLGALRLAVEPGRSLVGPAGVTLYEAGTIKRVAGLRTYVSIDGGMSDNLRPALYGSRYTIAAAGDGPAVGRQGPMTVVGKHCETGDVVAWDVPLPVDLTEGDLLAVAATGAYGYAMASNYNRLPRPAMVLVGGGDAQLLVRRETLEDVVARDVPLP